MGHQTCNAAELRGIDPRGIRQMDAPHPLDSLLAGINPITAADSKFTSSAASDHKMKIKMNIFNVSLKDIEAALDMVLSVMYND